VLKISFVTIVTNDSAFCARFWRLGGQMGKNRGGLLRADPSAKLKGFA